MRALLFFAILVWQGLQCLYVGCTQFAWVFRIAFYIKAYLLSFGKSFKTISCNAGEMDEHVISTLVIGNKSEPFAFIEPFYCTFIHQRYLLLFTPIVLLEKKHTSDCKSLTNI